MLQNLHDIHFLKKKSCVKSLKEIGKIDIFSFLICQIYWIRNNFHFNEFKNKVAQIPPKYYAITFSFDEKFTYIYI